ncbi:CPBP family intramembrane glutamic endopeptidase [Pyxidicoccus sp. MSG2]|uniref:CPBP family intramembrane glutamic endopeptidase n=1 Tax=Pyxidicoccus sp. MSG2 TaxID=2996790 RepID=UPI00227009E4|nr:type II CAAX endopeptidase family protein [Pyxidicoccus sp. MSG2]MCY1020888.1 type II CAAX endopeptidase family protein [Pyxidicoccus sp. MSG2]
MRSLFINAENRVRNGWKVLGYFAVTALFVMGLIFLRRALPDAVRPFAPEPFLAFLGALIPSWFFARLERTSLAAQGFELHRRAGRDFALGVAGGSILVMWVAFAVWLLDGFHWVRAPEGAALGLVKSAWTMLAVALFEETLFHGYAFQRAIRGMGPHWTQFLFATIFALAHPFGPDMAGSAVAVAMLNIFLAGWLLGFCYLRTGSLALPVGVHLGWNWMLGSLGFGVSGSASRGLWTPVFHGRPVWLTGGDYGLEASAVSIVILGLAVVGLARWRGARARAEAPAQVPPGLSPSEAA